MPFGISFGSQSSTAQLFSAVLSDARSSVSLGSPAPNTASASAGSDARNPASETELPESAVPVLQVPKRRREISTGRSGRDQRLSPDTPVVSLVPTSPAPVEDTMPSSPHVSRPDPGVIEPAPLRSQGSLLSVTSQASVASDASVRARRHWDLVRAYVQEKHSANVASRHRMAMLVMAASNASQEFRANVEMIVSQSWAVGEVAARCVALGRLIEQNKGLANSVPVFARLHAKVLGVLSSPDFFPELPEVLALIDLIVAVFPRRTSYLSQCGLWVLFALRVGYLPIQLNLVRTLELILTHGALLSHTHAILHALLSSPLPPEADECISRILGLLHRDKGATDQTTLMLITLLSYPSQHHSRILQHLTNFHSNSALFTPQTPLFSQLLASLTALLSTANEALLAETLQFCRHHLTSALLDAHCSVPAYQPDLLVFLSALLELLLHSAQVQRVTLDFIFSLSSSHFPAIASFFTQFSFAPLRRKIVIYYTLLSWDNSDSSGFANYLLQNTWQQLLTAVAYHDLSAEPLVSKFLKLILYFVESKFGDFFFSTVVAGVKSTRHTNIRTALLHLSLFQSYFPLSTILPAELLYLVLSEGETVGQYCFFHEMVKIVRRCIQTHDAEEEAFVRLIHSWEQVVSHLFEDGVRLDYCVAIMCAALLRQISLYREKFGLSQHTVPPWLSTIVHWAQSPFLAEDSLYMVLRQVYHFFSDDGNPPSSAQTPVSTLPVGESGTSNKPPFLRDLKPTTPATKTPTTTPPTPATKTPTTLGGSFTLSSGSTSSLSVDSEAPQSDTERDKKTPPPATPTEKTGEKKAKRREIHRPKLGLDVRPSLQSALTSTRDQTHVLMFAPLPPPPDVPRSSIYGQFTQRVLETRKSLCEISLQLLYVVRDYLTAKELRPLCFVLWRTLSASATPFFTTKPTVPTTSTPSMAAAGSAQTSPRKTGAAKDLQYRPLTLDLIEILCILLVIAAECLPMVFREVVHSDFYSPNPAIRLSAIRNFWVIWDLRYMLNDSHAKHLSRKKALLTYLSRKARAQAVQSQTPKYYRIPYRVTQVGQPYGELPAFAPPNETSPNFQVNSVKFTTQSRLNDLKRFFSIATLAQHLRRTDLSQKDQQEAKLSPAEIQALLENHYVNRLHRPYYRQLEDDHPIGLSEDAQVGPRPQGQAPAQGQPQQQTQTTSTASARTLSQMPHAITYVCLPLLDTLNDADGEVYQAGRHLLITTLSNDPLFFMRSFFSQLGMQSLTVNEALRRGSLTQLSPMELSPFAPTTTPRSNNSSAGSSPASFLQSPPFPTTQSAGTTPSPLSTATAPSIPSPLTSTRAQIFSTDLRDTSFFGLLHRIVRLHYHCLARLSPRYVNIMFNNLTGILVHSREYYNQGQPKVNVALLPHILPLLTELLPLLPGFALSDFQKATGGMLSVDTSEVRATQPEVTLVTSAAPSSASSGPPISASSARAEEMMSSPRSSPTQGVVGAGTGEDSPSGEAFWVPGQPSDSQHGAAQQPKVRRSSLKRKDSSQINLHAVISSQAPSSPRARSEDTGDSTAVVSSNPGVQRGRSLGQASLMGTLRDRFGMHSDRSLLSVRVGRDSNTNLSVQTLLRAVEIPLLGLGPHTPTPVDTRKQVAANQTYDALRLMFIREIARNHPIENLSMWALVAPCLNSSHFQNDVLRLDALTLSVWLAFFRSFFQLNPTFTQVRLCVEAISYILWLSTVTNPDIALATATLSLLREILTFQNSFFRHYSGFRFFLPTVISALTKCEMQSIREIIECFLWDCCALHSESFLLQLFSHCSPFFCSRRRRSRAGLAPGELLSAPVIAEVFALFFCERPLGLRSRRTFDPEVESQASANSGASLENSDDTAINLSEMAEWLLKPYHWLINFLSSSIFGEAGSSTADATPATATATTPRVRRSSFIGAGPPSATAAGAAAGSTGGAASSETEGNASVAQARAVRLALRAVFDDGDYFVDRAFPLYALNTTASLAEHAKTFSAQETHTLLLAPITPRAPTAQHSATRTLIPSPEVSPRANSTAATTAPAPSLFERLKSIWNPFASRAEPAQPVDSPASDIRPEESEPATPSTRTSGNDTRTQQSASRPSPSHELFTRLLQRIGGDRAVAQHKSRVRTFRVLVACACRNPFSVSGLSMMSMIASVVPYVLNPFQLFESSIDLQFFSQVSIIFGSSPLFVSEGCEAANALFPSFHQAALNIGGYEGVSHSACLELLVVAKELLKQGVSLSQEVWEIVCRVFLILLSAALSAGPITASSSVPSFHERQSSSLDILENFSFFFDFFVYGVTALAVEANSAHFMREFLAPILRHLISVGHFPKSSEKVFFALALLPHRWPACSEIFLSTGFLWATFGYVLSRECATSVRRAQIYFLCEIATVCGVSVLQQTFFSGRPAGTDESEFLEREIGLFQYFLCPAAAVLLECGIASLRFPENQRLRESHAPRALFAADPILSFEVQGAPSTTTKKGSFRRNVSFQGIQPTIDISSLPPSVQEFSALYAESLQRKMIHADVRLMWLQICERTLCILEYSISTICSVRGNNVFELGSLQVQILGRSLLCLRMLLPVDYLLSDFAARISQIFIFLLEAPPGESVQYHNASVQEPTFDVMDAFSPVSTVRAPPTLVLENDEPEERSFTKAAKMLFSGRAQRSHNTRTSGGECILKRFPQDIVTMVFVYIDYVFENQTTVFPFLESVLLHSIPPLGHVFADAVAQRHKLSLSN
eukprot:TRINITY_DN6033_c0_g1_i4.p1 TRINITY_DN6033_c0_g1~~TRINITY_DN6033_c0_g1_i4.p1  ORF type:complete len:2802 (-),score=581.83 TRINITY_DN6033_c0_g1_i4:38-8194(-)